MIEPPDKKEAASPGKQCGRVGKSEATLSLLSTVCGAGLFLFAPYIPDATWQLIAIAAAASMTTGGSR